MTYYNVAKGGPIHGHIQYVGLQKFDEVLRYACDRPHFGPLPGSAVIVYLVGLYTMHFGS